MHINHGQKVESPCPSSFPWKLDGASYTLILDLQVFNNKESENIVAWKPNRIMVPRHKVQNATANTKIGENHTLSKRRCNTTYFPVLCPEMSPELRSLRTSVSPKALICGTKANDSKLTLQRSRWMLLGKLSKAKRWENGAIAAIPYL